MVVHSGPSNRRRLIAPLAVALLAVLLAACQPVAPLDYPFGLANPRGSLDLVADGGESVRISGWASHGFVGDAWQPVGPPQIAVMVDDAWVAGLFPANLPRPDVDQAITAIAAAQLQADLAANKVREPSVLTYRQVDGLYGFDFTIPVLPGEHTVCVVVLNADWGNFGGEHVLLGCRTLAVT